jgi:hypothetical protein
MNRSASDARTAGINDIQEPSQELCDDLPHGAAISVMESRLRGPDYAF